MNLNEPFVITVSREIGSGGHTVGQILADRLNTRYCDKNLVETLEDRFNLSIEEIEKRKGEKKNWLADFFQHITPFPLAKDMGADAQFTQEFRRDVTTDDIYKAETESSWNWRTRVHASSPAAPVSMCSGTIPTT
jgi:hypothetical protein